MHQSFQCEKAGHLHGLCNALGRHIFGRLLHLWNTRADYRSRWAERAGRNLEELEQRFPPGDSRSSSLHCVHRGEIIGEATCAACPAEILRVPVYHCRLHGKCTLRKINGTLSACSRCRDRSPVSQVAVHRDGPQWAVGMTTAARDLGTLGESLRSARENGWTPIVFAEPGTDLREVSGPVIQRGQPLGCFHNWLSMLRELLELQPRAELILTLQDDVVLSPEVRRFIEQQGFPTPRCGLLSLYTSQRYSRDRLAPGPFRMPHQNWWGALAMVFRRVTAEQLVHSPLARDWNWAELKSPRRQASDPVEVKHVDTFVGQALKPLNWEIWGYHPSLSQHIGQTSSVGHGGVAGDRRAGPVSRNPFEDCLPPARESD